MDAMDATERLPGNSDFDATDWMVWASLRGERDVAVISRQLISNGMTHGMSPVAAAGVPPSSPSAVSSLIPSKRSRNTPSN